ncbi:MAG: Hpt domain-containing protein [Bacteroidaceae bacterium]|nr:Hpt domain-containing protein [Bacteroidaceae bacterium]
MNIQEFYKETDSNYEEAVKRLMNDKFLTRFVKQFPTDPSYPELAAALEADDTQKAFLNAHTLKGVCKNLSFTQLADTSSEITEILRAENLAEAKEYFPKVKADYDRIIAALSCLE